MEIESHPFEPFLPENAKVLMLGSFPPPETRWSMKFYYPNKTNDMWRIMGLVFYNDKDKFIVPGGYDEDAISIYVEDHVLHLRGEEKEITKPGSKVRVFVIPTNEELVIARETRDIVTAMKR